MGEKINLKGDEAALVIREDGSVQAFLHKQPSDELLSLANYKIGLLAFALQDEKTVKVLMNNFEKQYKKIGDQEKKHTVKKTKSKKV